MELPISLQELRSRAKAPPPALGAHTTEVLTQLDYGESELAQLRQRDVVA